MDEKPYRSPAPFPPDPYAAARRKLRWRRIARRVLVGLGVYVASLSLSWISYRITNMRSCLIGGREILLTTALAMVVISGALVPAWKGLARRAFICPHCERSFFKTLGEEVWMMTMCAHCRITVGTPKHVADVKNKIEL